MHEPSGRDPRGLGALVGLPQAQPFEAPSSWITRAALSQGVSPRKLLLFMGFSAQEIRNTDLDLLLISNDGLRALKQAGSLAHMPVAERIFKALLTIDPEAKALLRDSKAKSRSRFCPLCLRSQRQPHLEVHGRFSPWRFCPLHNCLMEDVCPHCSMALELPFDMSRAGKDRSGVASLSGCQHCGGKLHQVEPVLLNHIVLDTYERLRVSNGRAFLAALYSSKVILKEGECVALRECKPYLKAVTFWGPSSWHSAHEIRRSSISWRALRARLMTQELTSWDNMDSEILCLPHL